MFRMICDVHFGDMRNDLTPASLKWLPNDHTEEQTHDNNKLLLLHTYLPVKNHLTHIFNRTRYPLFPLLLLHTRTHSTMQVRKERRRGITKLFEMLNVVCSADVNIPNPRKHMICDVHFGDTRNDITPVLEMAAKRPY